MVNIHISQENKALFKSKNAITKLKKFLKDTGDVGLISDVEYLKEGYQFVFKEEGDEIYVNTKAEEHIWGKQLESQKNSLGQQVQKPQSGRDKLRQRLAELKAQRNGQTGRELRSMRKYVDKNIFDRYLWIQQNVSGLSIPKPTDVLEEPLKYKEQIEVFGSGFMKISGKEMIDRKIHEYFKLLGEKVGIPPLSMQQIQERVQAPQTQAPQTQAPPENSDLISNINLSNYVDSDTESETSDTEV